MSLTLTRSEVIKQKSEKKSRTFTIIEEKRAQYKSFILYDFIDFYRNLSKQTIFLQLSLFFSVCLFWLFLIED